MNIFLIFPTLGLLWFTAQILFHTWKQLGVEFAEDFGTTTKVFPPFAGEYVAAPKKQFRKFIYRYNQ